MPQAALAVTPTVVARQFGNVTEGAVWWELHEIGSVLHETWLWGSTNRSGGEGALLWAESGLKVRASDLVVNDHPLADLGIAVGVQALGRGFGAGAEGLVLQGVLRCADDASLDGRQAVLRCAGNECSYLLSSYDEMQLGDALLTPSGVADVAGTRAGEVVAVLQVRGGLVPQYGLVRTTDTPPPGHVEALLLEEDEIRDEAGAVVGALDDLVVPPTGDAVTLLAWSGETMLLATVNEPGNGRQRHVLRDGVSVRRPGQALGDHTIQRLSSAALGENGALFLAGDLEKVGDVTDENNTFLAYGESIALREGDACPGLPGYTFTGSTPVPVADQWGNAAFVWDAINGAGERLGVLYYNGELLLKTGDLIDANGDGLIDADDHGSTVVDLHLAGEVVLGRQTLTLLAEAILPQYGLRTVMLRLGPLPTIANPWDLRTPCPGDVTGDRVIDQADLGLLLAAYEQNEASPAYDPRADFDADGDVDQADLGVLIAAYETICE
jgi:Dockerin type I domain